MNEEKLYGYRPGEVFCPNCAKPVDKKFVVCPNCGIQLKELKVSTGEMQLTPEQELNEGKRQLSGIRGFYWFFIVLFSLGFIITMSMSLSGVYGSINSIAGYIITIFSIIIGFSIILSLHIIPLVGINKRKPYSVPFTRVMLFLTLIPMGGILIGLIVGFHLLKRINHPAAKKYLNYGS